MTPHPRLIEAWRGHSLMVLDAQANATQRQREIAWKFLMQHGVSDRDTRPCDTNTPEDSV